MRGQEVSRTDRRHQEEAENARRRGLEVSEQWKRRYCEDGGVEVVLEVLVGLELVRRPGGKGGGRY